MTFYDWNALTHRNYRNGTYSCGGTGEGKFYYETTYRSNVHAQNCEMDQEYLTN